MSLKNVRVLIKAYIVVFVLQWSNIKAIKSSYQRNYANGKIKWVGDKEKKMNLF